MNLCSTNSKPPRLQVNFHYDAGLQQPAILPEGVTLKSIPAVSAGTVYELSATVLEDEGDFRLELEYNSALFDAETIDRMLGHYQTLLESVVGDPAAPVSKTPLLTREERQQLGLEPGPLDAPAPASPRYSRTLGRARDGKNQTPSRRDTAVANSVAPNFWPEWRAPEMQIRATALRPISIRRRCGWPIGGLESIHHRLSSRPDLPRSRLLSPLPLSRCANGPAWTNAIGSLPALSRA